jgi:hypothetical protein
VLSTVSSTVTTHLLWLRTYTCHSHVGALALRYDIRIPTNRQPTKFGIGQTLDYAHPFLSRIAFVQQFEGTVPPPRAESARAPIRNIADQTRYLCI